MTAINRRFLFPRDFFHTAATLNIGLNATSRQKAATTFVTPKAGTITNVSFYVANITGVQPVSMRIQGVTLNRLPDGIDKASFPSFTPIGGTWYDVAMSLPVTLEESLAFLWEWTSTVGTNVNFGFSQNQLGDLTSARADWNGTTWAFSNSPIGIGITYSDGSKYLIGVPVSNVNFTAYTNAGSEVATKFVAEFDAVIEGFSALCTTVQNSVFDVLLYDSSWNVLASKSMTHDKVGGTGWFNFLFTAPYQVIQGQTYYLSIKPTTSIQIRNYFATFQDNSYFANLPLGLNHYRVTRTIAGGVVTESPNTKAVIVPIYSSVPSGGQSGGGQIIGSGIIPRVLM